MQSKIEKVLSIASPPLRPSIPEIPHILAEKGERGQELYGMLEMRNGFFAFESALHIYPLGSGEGLDLERWNSASLWRSEYEDMTEGLLFFAEDAFGYQFAFRDDSIVSFDPETGEVADFGETLEDWSNRILNDYNCLTGYPLIHEWQLAHGLLPLDHRLAPRIPFAMGGEYSLGNLYVTESIKIMRFRASLARQIRDLPDGTPINLMVL